ncbi:MAG: TerB family tellurite resistance protein [Myxococcota bacterium]|nr:TerB family tellurite resistance protein [Myxococcota bacterium]
MLQSLDRTERIQLMKFVCSFAWADLEVRPEEREFVAQLIQRLEMDDIETQQVRGWLTLPPRPEAVDPTKIPSEHRRLFIGEIRGVIESDGNVTVEELENLDLLERLIG